MGAEIENTRKSFPSDQWQIQKEEERREGRQ